MARNERKRKRKEKELLEARTNALAAEILSDFLSETTENEELPPLPLPFKNREKLSQARAYLESHTPVDVRMGIVCRVLMLILPFTFLVPVLGREIREQLGGTAIEVVIKLIFFFFFFFWPVFLGIMIALWKQVKFFPEFKALEKVLVIWEHDPEALSLWLQAREQDSKKFEKSFIEKRSRAYRYSLQAFEEILGTRPFTRVGLVAVIISVILGGEVLFSLLVILACRLIFPFFRRMKPHAVPDETSYTIISETGIFTAGQFYNMAGAEKFSGYLCRGEEPWQLHLFWHFPDKKPSSFSESVTIPVPKEYYQQSLQLQALFKARDVV